MHHGAKSYAILRPLQGSAANSDAKRPIASRGSEEFFATAQFKNFIPAHLTRIGRDSVFLNKRPAGTGLSF
jgi:hypothetical protein